MRLYVITFSDPETAELVKKEYHVWARITETCYCIKTRDQIQNVLGKMTGRSLIVDISDSGWASYGVPRIVTDWMK